MESYQVYMGLVLLGIWLVYTLALKQPSSSAQRHPKDAGTKRELRTYTMEEVAAHNTREDVWVVLKSKVYDVSSYVEEHPGGDAILNNAGGDSTKEFFGPQHPARVFDMIDDFYIGELVETKKDS